MTKLKIAIGTLLMIAGITMSPFLLPDDLITEPIYIAFFTGSFGKETGMIAFALWTILGYTLFIIGFILVGHGLHKIGAFGNIGKTIKQILSKYPKTIAIVFFGTLLLIILGIISPSLGIITVIGMIFLLTAFAYLFETHTFLDKTFLVLLAFGFIIIMFAEIPALQILNPSLNNLLNIFS